MAPEVLEEVKAQTQQEVPQQEAPVQPQEDAPEQPQQPGAADVIGGILGTVLAGQTQTKGRRTKKTSTQKVVERAAGQMASTAAREVTKGIMRGIFGQMK